MQNSFKRQAALLSMLLVVLPVAADDGETLRQLCRFSEYGHAACLQRLDRYQRTHQQDPITDFDLAMVFGCLAPDRRERRPDYATDCGPGSGF